jgi:uncharacterized protein (DUF1499 family)
MYRNIIVLKSTRNVKELHVYNYKPIHFDQQDDNKIKNVKKVTEVTAQTTRVRNQKSKLN